MLVQCPRCTLAYNDEFRVALCPHHKYLASQCGDTPQSNPDGFYLGPVVNAPDAVLPLDKTK